MAPRFAPPSLRPTHFDEELNRRLEEELNVFRNAGLRLQHLTINDFVEIFVTFEDAVKLLRFLESFITQGILLPLISQAQHHTILLAKASLDAGDLCDVADWLKTPEGSLVIRKVQTEQKLLKKATVQRSALLKTTEGSLVIRKVQTERKLVKKVAVQHSAQVIAYTQLLKEEHHDLSSKLKENRNRVELRIAELKAQIQQMKDKVDKDVAKIKEEYSAAANFPDPSIKRLREMCWARYLDKCTADGSAPICRTNDALKMVTEEFRREVLQTIVNKYCADENVRRQLIAYGKRKIKFLKAGNRKRELERFRHLFAIAAGSTADEGDSDGSGGNEPASARLLEAFGEEEFEGSVTPKGLIRRKKKAPSPARASDEGDADATPVAKSERRRASGLDDSSI